MKRLSVIVPVLNEADGIGRLLDALQPLRERGHEVIVADGGSTDGTAERCRDRVDRCLTAPPGRAAQMNAGAAIAIGDRLLFLHADTRLPPDADRLVADALAERSWGRFDVRIEGRHPLLPVVAWGMNLRSRLTGVATGDQAMFCTRAAFDAAGGFPPLPLMEDVALSKRLRARGWPACLRARVVTSGRRWERDGALRTILLMWRLRLAYFLGADPATLVHRYRRHDR